MQQKITAVPEQTILTYFHVPHFFQNLNSDVLQASLNLTLEDHQCPLPTPKSIFVTLNGGNYFATINLADAHLSIKIEEE